VFVLIFQILFLFIRLSFVIIGYSPLFHIYNFYFYLFFWCFLLLGLFFFSNILWSMWTIIIINDKIWRECVFIYIYCQIINEKNNLNRGWNNGIEMMDSLYLHLFSFRTQIRESNNKKHTTQINIIKTSIAVIFFSLLQQQRVSSIFVLFWPCYNDKTLFFFFKKIEGD